MSRALVTLKGTCNLPMLHASGQMTDGARTEGLWYFLSDKADALDLKRKI